MSIIAFPSPSEHPCLDGIALAVDASRRTGGILHLEAAVERLVVEEPDGGMTRGEIRELLVKFAASHGVTVEFG